MTKTFQAGLRHKGFSFIEVLQSCPSFNHMTPHEWYQTRVKDVANIKNYDPKNIEKAMQIAEDLETLIAIGVLYKNPDSAPFMDRQANRLKIKTELTDEVRQFSTGKLFDAFR